MAKHAWTPPEPTEGAEGFLFAHRVVKASRQFLQANPEGKKTYPPLRAWNSAMDHLHQYPGDIPLFEGQPAPKGRRAK
jgi:hypothetical protein